MYKEHSCFDSISHNQQILKYMDFTKYVQMLNSKSLFFTRADKFEDHFEGSIPEPNFNARGDMVFERLMINKENIKKKLSKFNMDGRTQIFINCWNISDYESQAMWNLYLKSKDGIAIKSSFRKLKESLSVHEQDDIFIGKVKYIDYSKDTIPSNNAFFPFLHKRISFKHENELRAVVHKFDIDNDYNILEEPVAESGIYINCDLRKLIKSVFISPTSDNWFHELVKSINVKYSLNVETHKSDISKDPLF